MPNTIEATKSTLQWYFFYRHSGIKNTTITTLPSGWTSNLTKSDNKNGSLAITGRVL